jgi:hypothetical protein
LLGPLFSERKRTLSRNRFVVAVVIQSDSRQGPAAAAVADSASESSKQHWCRRDEEEEVYKWIEPETRDSPSTGRRGGCEGSGGLQRRVRLCPGYKYIRLFLLHCYYSLFYLFFIIFIYLFFFFVLF